jgi:hypothetical protein
MKIAIFTEGKSMGKITKDFAGRTDINWIIALEATHYNIHDRPKELYDIGIYIIPKQYSNLSFDLKNLNCRKVGIMQEGNHTYWQDWTVFNQFEYYKLLSNVDFILCHNEIDKKYYKGLFNKPTYILPTLLLDYNIDKNKLTLPHNRIGTLISGNFTSWYSGIDSYLVSRALDEPIYAPSMGRKPESEDLIDDITHIPYSNWNDWLYKLSNMKYGVNMMRTYAAGSFSLACGYLGIPCLGYNSLDPQRILFPELTVEEGDIEKTMKIVKHLKTNKIFYDHVSAYAKHMYDTNYNVNIFNKKTKEIFDEVLSK